MLLSKRTQSVDSSGIRRVFELGSSLKNPINLSIGQPDFDALPEVRAAAHQAIDSRKSGYTTTQGIEQLRGSLAAHHGVAEDPAYDVMVTSGVSGGLLLAYMAMLDPGDEILIPDPYFCMYRDLAKMIHAVPCFIDTYPDFKLTAARLEQCITPRTRVVIVSSPSNPTGVVLSRDEVADLVELTERNRLWLIFDEIYERFVFDGEHASPRLRGTSHVLVVNGFSKSHGIPGWRIGYAVGPKALLNEMQKLQQYTFVCAPSIAQWAMRDGVHANSAAIQDAYRAKRDLVCRSLEDILRFVKPGGSFYLFAEAPGGSGQNFIERCIREELLLVPGNVFSQRDTHFRLSFAAPEETLKRGIEVVRRLAV